MDSFYCQWRASWREVGHWWEDILDQFSASIMLASWWYVGSSHWYRLNKYLEFRHQINKTFLFQKFKCSLHFTYWLGWYSFTHSKILDITFEAFFLWILAFGFEYLFQGSDMISSLPFSIRLQNFINIFCFCCRNMVT